MKLQRNIRPNFGFLFLAPTFNVMLILAVCLFFVPSQFSLRPGISLAPATSSFFLKPQQAAQVVSITHAPAPAIYFENHKITPEALSCRLAELAPATRTLIIQADRRAPVELVVAVTAIAAQQGLATVLASSERR